MPASGRALRWPQKTPSYRPWTASATARALQAARLPLGGSWRTFAGTVADVDAKRGKTTTSVTAADCEHPANRA